MAWDGVAGMSGVYEDSSEDSASEGHGAGERRGLARTVKYRELPPSAEAVPAFAPSRQTPATIQFGRKVRSNVKQFR